MYNISESRALRVDIKRDKEGYKGIQFIMLQDGEAMDLTGKSFQLTFFLTKGEQVAIDPEPTVSHEITFNLSEKVADLKGEVIAYRLSDGEDIYATGRFFWGLSESDSVGTLVPSAIQVNVLLAEGAVSGITVLKGKSAYDYAVEGGYEGTESEYAELQGATATARDEAVNAQQAAETAREEVEEIKDSFIRNSSDTFGAKVTEIVSLTEEDYETLPLKLNTTLYVQTLEPTDEILQIVSLTQEEYDELLVKDENVLYVII